MTQFTVDILFNHAKSHTKFKVKQLVMMVLLLLPFQTAFTAGINKNFDHFETNFILNGAHERTKCASCHNRGLFKGTPTQCTGCHSTSSNIAVSNMPSTHIKTTESCDNCHTENRWSGARLDHNSITGSCYSCHNGRNATGKSSQHVSSSNLCDDCHRTFGWRPARFTHDNVTQPCANCHNGSKARGKSASHVQTTSTCDTCHSTRGWRPAKFVHDNIVSNCIRCHNGTTATGKPLTGHVQTTAGCETCHKTRAWRPATFVHDAVTGSCNNCHNGRTARGQNTGHFTTTEQCDTCHTDRGWKPARYSHAGNYPDHGARLSCKNCHQANNKSIQWQDVGLSPDCGGCHRNDYVANKHENLNVVGLKNCAGTCHKPKPQHSTRDSSWKK